MKPVIGVLRGGPSSEYEVSLRSGAAVLAGLNRDKYEPRDIFIDREGQWHLHGAPVDAGRALRGVDAAFNVVHGEYGEDGRLARTLESHGVPYTGTDAFTSALVYNKQRTREEAAKLGMKIAHGIIVERAADGNLSQIAFDIFRSFPMPAIIKPVTGGSSVGMSIARDLQSLTAALEKALTYANKALVEEFIRGREATVGVVDHFRGERAYALLPVEIIPAPAQPFFDYDAKYGGESQELCPGNFTEPEKNELMDAARLIHEHLALPHYSRSDFIVSKRGVYFLEVNSAAAVGLTEQSLLPKALQAVGAPLPHFLEHVIELARNGGKN